MAQSYDPFHQMIGQRLTINAKPNRALVSQPRLPNHANPAFVANQMANPMNPMNPNVGRFAAPFHANNMIGGNSGQARSCRCDPEYVNFCKLHGISHSECYTRGGQVVCQLCSTTADYKSIQWHLSSDKHKERHGKLMEYLFVLSIPDYSSSHAMKMTELIERVYRTVSVFTPDYERRVQAVNTLNEMMKTNGLENYSLRMFGSTITRTATNNGFALRESDLNLEIVCNNNESDKSERSINTLALILDQFADLIPKYPELYDNVKNEFNLKTPKLLFRDRVNNIVIEVTIMCQKSYRLSKLLQNYSEIDDRVCLLGIAFREWARIYGFDDQENGLWPSFTFPILAIHFLQQCSPPVVPCLHELLASTQSAETNPQQPTEEDEKPNETAAKQSPAKATQDENDSEDDYFNVKGLKWPKTNTKSVGELWLDMLRYYAVHFDFETFAVSIRTTKPVRTREDKPWSTRMLAVEDPVRPSFNLSRSVGSMKLFNSFFEQLRHTYRYFSVPFVATDIPSSNSIGNSMNVKPLYTERDFEIVVNRFQMVGQKVVDCFDVSELNTQINQIGNSANKSEPMNQSQNQRGSDDSDSDDEKRKENFHPKANRILKHFGIWMELLPDLQTTAQLIHPDRLSYTFNLRQLPFFRAPDKFCRLCHRYGHLQSRCPKQELPKLKTLPEVLSPQYADSLSNIFKEIFISKQMEERDLIIQENIISDLQQFIQKELPKAVLELFGSTRNGFGARQCDLDICCTFEDNPTGEGLELRKILEGIVELLHSHPRLEEIQGIPSAKVPIVKFKYMYDRDRRVECDISMYNILGVHNTKLLKTYTKIDDRVAVLGFIVKHFAKTCDICDASRGSLSSYAYTLMTIHYLQQIGIIPVLQEIGLDTKEERVVEGWDTWFFSDLDNLGRYWTAEPNNDSVAQLFFGFLRYYSTIFNFDDHVVCCRQMTPLRRLEKMWTGCRIAIEDPFQLVHNLGAGVSAQMAIFIRCSLIKGHNHFGTMPTADFDKNRFSSWKEYFFCRHYLTDGLPPAGRGCLLCGKIGHKQNVCPEKKMRRRTNSDRYDRRGQNDRRGQETPFANRMDRNPRQENWNRKDANDRPSQQRREDNNERNERMERTERNHRFDANNRPERYDQRADRQPARGQSDRTQTRSDRTDVFRDRKVAQNNRRK